MKKFTCLYLLIILFAGGIFSETTGYTTSGNMTADETWETPTVVLTGNLIVNVGVTLTISSGTTVNLNGYWLRIDGALVNNGTIANYSCYEKAGSNYKAYYPTNLNTDITVLEGRTVTCAATTNLSGHYIYRQWGSYGTITINQGVKVIPDMQLKKKSSGAIVGLFSDIEWAVGTCDSDEQVELRSAVSLEHDTELWGGGGLENLSTLVVKYPGRFILNGYRLSAFLCYFTMEKNVQNVPDIRVMWEFGSPYVEHLVSNIQKGLNFCYNNNWVYLPSASYTENISMKDNSWLQGAGITKTTLNGTVTFNNVEDAWLVLLSVSQQIDINGGDGCHVDNVAAKSIIDIDNGVNHDVYQSTTLSNGYIETYCNELYIYDVTSKNTKTWGVVGYGSDPYIQGGAYENKTRAIHMTNFMDSYIEDVDFCTQAGESEYDIWADASSHADVAVMSGSFSECPFPNSFYGDVDVVLGSCTYCGRLSKSLVDGELEAPEESAMYSTNKNYSEPALKYREIKEAYNEIRKSLHNDRRINRSTSAYKFAADYQKIIDSALQFVDEYPDSPEAGKVLRLIAYSYRSLHQHEKIMAVAEKLCKSFPQLKAAVRHVQIPYLLEANRFDEALRAADEMHALAQDKEQQQAALYRKAKILHNYMKNDAEALAVYDQMISINPKSHSALMASERVETIRKNSEPVHQTAANMANFEFSAVNYPNPANPGTTIKYNLPEDGHVNIAIYNIVGQRVSELTNTFMQKGNHTVRWDGTDRSGNVSATGLYFYQIQFKDKMLTNKFLLVK